MYNRSGWRYLWARYLPWFPIQWCIVCGRAYWGGLPARDWMPVWSDYCSRKCCLAEEAVLERAYSHLIIKDTEMDQQSYTHGEPSQSPEARQEPGMEPKLFGELLESATEMGQIVRGEAQPSRVTEIDGETGARRVFTLFVTKPGTQELIVRQEVGGDIEFGEGYDAMSAWQAFCDALGQVQVAPGDKVIRVFLDGSAWCALYGPDLVEGIAGFGATDIEAIVRLGHQLQANYPNAIPAELRNANFIPSGPGADRPVDVSGGIDSGTDTETPQNATGTPSEGSDEDDSDGPEDPDDSLERFREKLMGSSGG